MVSRNLALILGLGLASCGPDESGWYQLSSMRPTSQDTKNEISFHSRRVMILYPTMDGPRTVKATETELYSSPRSLNPELLDGVQRELLERRAYVQSRGLFNAHKPGSYEQAINIMPQKPRNWDAIVIADIPRKMAGDVRDVYFAVPNGKKYDFVEANNK